MTIEDRIERLARILAAEEEFYARLRSLLQREQACLVDLDARELEDIVRTKQALAEEGQLLEYGRSRLCADVVAELGLSGTPSLSELGAHLGERGRALRSAHARLVAVVGAVRELADVNVGFTGDALGRVEATLQLLGRLRPEQPIYGSSGLEAAAGTGRLLRGSA